MVRQFLFSLAIPIVLSGSTSARAETHSTKEPLPSYIPLPSYSEALPEIDVLMDTTKPSRSPLAIPANSISDRALSRPSLWWIRDQLPHKFANKLVLNWVAYPEKKYVDILVNPQFWNLLEYGERYALINRYGIAARKEGYNVRIFNSNFSKERPIAAYTCTANPAERRCRIQFQEKNQRFTNINTFSR